MFAADAASTKLLDRLIGLFRNRRRPANRFGAVHRNHRKVGRLIRRSFCERNRAQSGIVATILRLSAGSILTRLLVSSIGLSSVVLNVLATIDRPHIALVGVFNANRQKLNAPSAFLNRPQRGTRLGSGTWTTKASGLVKIPGRKFWPRSRYQTPPAYLMHLSAPKNNVLRFRNTQLRVREGDEKQHSARNGFD